MPYIVIAALVVIALVILFIIKEVNITIREYRNINRGQPLDDEKNKISKDISQEPLIEGPKEQLDNKSQITANFPVKIGDKVIFIKVENIVSFTADNIYVNLNDIDCNKYLLDNSLSNLELRLPVNFIRVHRSTIVNRNLIKEIHKYLNGRFALFMKDKIGTKFISGQSYAAKIKELIEI
jgi:two-component system, LytTR family, response regulator